MRRVVRRVIEIAHTNCDNMSDMVVGNSIAQPINSDNDVTSMKTNTMKFVCF
jgi:hypothetical protein